MGEEGKEEKDQKEIDASAVSGVPCSFRAVWCRAVSKVLMGFLRLGSWGPGDGAGTHFSIKTRKEKKW